MKIVREIALFALVLAGTAWVARADEGTNAPARPARRPIVVMKQSEIRGRVFFLPDDAESKENQMATGQRVEVRKEDGSDVLYTTVTDMGGEYSIPNLDLGRYQLRVGRLILELKVDEAAGNEQRKKIVVFIPRSLAEKGK